VAASAAPCTTVAPECGEWVVFNGGPARSFVYRSHALDAKDGRITRALIVIHGQGRNADDYFRTGVAAAFLAGALDDTIVVAPRFTSRDGGCADTLAAGEVNWRCSGDSWRSGAPAINFDSLTSYDFTDAILRKLARKDVFPNLKAIVVSGHSAGGQYVSRYVMASQLHETLGVPVTYVVSNPSSYAYLDGGRPALEGSGFRPYYDARNCTTYNRWPYGLTDRTGAAAKLPDAHLKRQIAGRPVVYLLGELDILPLAGFDSSCPAMAQGPTRLARGQAYARYMNENYGAKHSLTVVPLCGHNARCMFTADPALTVLFPKP
jgi:pimeloyl-ACP methyl ester carboxylesterase